MLKIGDFSQVAHVTVKTLRHYGRIGLLRPAWVDRFSGYRYYSLDQLPRLNRILALKELGFSLEQITDLLDRNPDMDELRSILHSKRLELEDRLHAEQARLAQIETRLEQIDQGGELSHYEVALKVISDQAVISAREVVREAALAGRRAIELRRRLLRELSLLNLRPAGPWLTIRHNPEYADHNQDLEVAVVVDLPSGRPARRKPLRVLAGAAKMACLMHPGPMSELSQAYTALYAWLEANGYRAMGPLREVCHADLNDEEEECRLFELQLPVERILPPRQDETDRQTQKESSMEPKFVTKPAFMLVGMKYVGKNQNQEIAEMWGRFNPFIDALASHPIQATYGWCGMPDEEVEEGAFEYVAAVENPRADRLPDWAVVRLIPECTYAVFEHRGALETLGQTYHQIYDGWLPSSKYERGAPFDLEVYTDEFKDFTPDSIMYIYIPVKEK